MCSVGPVYDYEYHLNNDIVLALQNYFDVTGNKTWLENEGYPIMEAVSSFWASKVVKEDDGKYHAYNMTDPGEYKIERAKDNKYRLVDF